MLTHAGRYPRRPEKGVESLGAGVVVNPPTWVLGTELRSLEGQVLLPTKPSPDKLFLRNHTFLFLYPGFMVKPMCIIQYE